MPAKTIRATGKCQEILNRVIRGRAVEEVLSQIEDRITATLLHVTKGDVAVTCDLRQQTFESLIKQFNTHWENFPAYCAKIAVNTFYRWAKNRKTEPIDCADSLDETYEDGDRVREVEATDDWACLEKTDSKNGII